MTGSRPAASARAGPLTFAAAAPAGHGLGGQASGALLLEGGKPAANAAGVDPQEVGDLLGGVALAHALDSEATAVLQDLG